MKTNINFFNLTALKCKQFKTGDSQFAAFALITIDKMLTLSRITESQIFAELFPVDRTIKVRQNSKVVELEKAFTGDHALYDLFCDQEKQLAFLVTSSLQISNKSSNSLIDSITV